MNKATLIEKIAELSSDKKIEGISEIRDESNREGIRIVLELGPGEIPQIVLNQLYKHTQMQTTFGIIMLALVDRRPQVVNLKQMLQAFIEVPPRDRHAADALRPRARRGARPHPRGLRKARRASRPRDPPHPPGREPRRGAQGPHAQLELTEIQARAILDMRLQRLTQLERHKIVEEHEQALALIEELKGILASDVSG